MINDLLEVTRVQAGKLLIDLERTSIPDAVIYTVNTLQGAAAAKEIALRSDIEGQIPSVCADPTRLQQILVILVDNAIRFTPAGGTVSVQVRMLEEDPNFVVLKVSDSGHGISPDMTERIFERLFQSPDPALAGRKGLGLGLYICKELVTRQGGKIWATSAPGQGAVLSVTLPVFSLPNLIAPAFGGERRAECPITLVVTEIGSETGWLSDEVRAEQSHWARDLLQQCLHSDLDVLLPKMSSTGAVELFFIVAITDDIGGEAITKRICGRLEDRAHIQHPRLTYASTYRSIEAVSRKTNESTAAHLENVATKIQELINEEISSRMVRSEQ
jgi:hypothetical protein